LLEPGLEEGALLGLQRREPLAQVVHDAADEVLTGNTARSSSSKNAIQWSHIEPAAECSAALRLR
jgi:hypothetical protein